MKAWFALVTLALTPLASAFVTLPGVQADGSVKLPNQWSLRPAGVQVPVGDLPSNVAIHPKGRYAAVLHSGLGKHEVRLLDLESSKSVQAFPLAETFYGLAWSADGRRLFVSGAGAEVVHVLGFKAGRLETGTEIRLRPAQEKGVVAGLALSKDGGQLFVADLWGQRIDCVTTKTASSMWSRSLALPQGWDEMTPQSVRTRTGFDPSAPFPYTCLYDEEAHVVYVSLWGGGAILVLDARTGKDVARWPVGEHPNEMVLSKDHRLFVSESNFNTVSVIDTRTGKISEVLNGALYPKAPPGSMPNSLALSPDGETLYVANANNNNVAVFDVSKKGNATAQGFIPVGWFPTAVRVTPDGGRLLVANAKGVKSLPNPNGPFPGDTRPDEDVAYIGGLFLGTVSLIDLPEGKSKAAQQSAWTRDAYACSPLNAAATAVGDRPEGSPIPASPAVSSPLKHVVYIIRENRTYDQVFGDETRGNGDPRLCLFPEEVTPNAHALAREFVLLDNFFADGEVSSDGHEWSMAAYATDFVEKGWPLSYGHNDNHKYPYPSEGRYPAAYPANGYLWDRAAEAGVSYRSYGEFTVDGAGTAKTPAKTLLPALKGHIDELYPSWNTDITDGARADRFIAELHRFEEAGDMPRLQVLQLPCDHTVGTSPGKLTPAAMVAENDLALGRIVEAVSHSKFWNDTVIFVLEDDAQNGPDHVDAHRIPALVVSPWTRRHAVDSSLYSTTSMLRTMELILGLQPMSQFDAAALPMWASFSKEPQFAPFSHLSARVDVTATNSKLAWGAEVSRKMDFSEPDLADESRLNEIIWRSVKGASVAPPGTVRAAFFVAHPRDDDDD